MYELYFKLQEFLKKIFMFIVYVCSALIPSILFFQVIFRYFIKKPLLGIEEIATALFIWLVIFGTAVLYREKQHIIVDAFVQKLSDRPKRYVRLLTEVLTAVIFLFLLKSCLLALPMQTVYKSVVLGIPKTAHTVAFMISLIYMFIATMESIISDLKNEEGRVL